MDKKQMWIGLALSIVGMTAQAVLVWMIVLPPFFQPTSSVEQPVRLHVEQKKKIEQLQNRLALAGLTLVVGLGLYAQGRGRSAVWGLMGFLGIIGAFVVFVSMKRPRKL
jgi:hypothetical protein